MYKERIAEMRNRISYLERLIRLMPMINSTLERDPLLDIIVRVATELTDTASASIMLIDEETGELRFVAASGEKAAEVKPVVVPMEGSIAGTVATENKPLLISDAQSDPRWYQQADQETGFVTRSIIAVPMEVRGRVIGVVEALNKRGGAELAWDDVETLNILANQAAIAIQNARLLAELQAAYDELNELDRRKSDFIAIAAHELRTPLSLILGYAMFLKEDASGTAIEQLDIVLDSAMRLRSLIEDMVNLREVDAGEARLGLESVDVRDLVATAVEENQSIAVAKGQQVLVSFSNQEPVVVQVDRNKISLALVNLLSNAIKFTGHGGKVGIRVGRKGDSAWFTVWDTGIGIPSKELDRIFDRFYQVESSLVRHYEGMGLGLAIVKEMVELHHGRIKVDSQEGRGSAFTVTIPMRQPA
jgi:signal transduction histidine kinase